MKIIGDEVKRPHVNPINEILKFIIETYPVSEYPNILEIAAGDGNLSSLLSNYGYHVTAMDPKIRYKEGLSYDVIREIFSQETDISSYDLGIAIHPCGIHKDIISNFKINDKAMFLMPCFNFTCDNRELTSYKDNIDWYTGNDIWLDYLEKLNPKMKRKIFFKNPIYDLNTKSFSNAFYTK